MTEKLSEFDILVKGGLIFDGTGSMPFEADIGISGDKILFVNQKSNHSHKAKKIVEAKGLAVTPGFIDTHAHSEFTLLADPRAEGKICQGITTEINGNCGLSAAPLYGKAFEQREGDLLDLNISDRWTNFKEYFDILEKKGVSVNFVTLVGHGNVRACVAGYEDKKLKISDRRKMSDIIKKSIREGAIGISTGLIYPPGIYSDTAELISIAKHCNNFIYASHMRSEGERLIESIKEAIKIGSSTGIKVHISHIKTSGEKNWHKIDGAISLIEKARNKGIKITCDRYPYTASSTDLDSMLPSWVFEGGIEKELERLRKSDVRNELKRKLFSEHPETKHWENIKIASVSSEKNKWMEGKSIAYISHHKDSDPVDIFFQILIEENLRVAAIFCSMSEDNLKRFLSLPYVMIGTDSSARCSNGLTHKGKPHPRGFGSCPRFLGKYVRGYSLLDMNEAIHKITMLPALTFNIKKRGILKKGYFADIIIFDSKEIIDRATFEEPFLQPKGIYYVFVNGKPAIWEGKLTGINAGRVLRHGR
jgi:N-acyl-D-amino-acid deacylase